MSVPSIAIVVGHPTQHQAPLFSFLGKDPRFRLKVLYLTRHGIEPFHFKGLGGKVSYDIPLLEGYDYTFMKNHSPLAKTYGRWDNLALDIYKTVAEEKFDAVCVYGYYYISCWLAFHACWRNKTPVFLRGESEMILPRSAANKFINRQVLTRLFRRLDGFLYIGEGNKEFYLDYGVPPEKLFFVPYCADNEFYRGEGARLSETRGELRQSLGFGEETTVFLFSSKHREAKRPLDAVKAFCEVPPGLDVALVVLGDGPLRAEVEAYARAHGQGRKIHFLGFRPVSELPNYMAMADVLVLPSIENWGAVINEALASGLAILCSDQVVGWFDMVKPGVNGLVYRAGWTKSLAAHMTAMSSDRALITRMKGESLKLSNYLSFETCADGVAAALEYVTGGKRVVEPSAAGCFA
jgi:glycosyltransferase involved in cell wall biosynthesis